VWFNTRKNFYCKNPTIYFALFVFLPFCQIVQTSDVCDSQSFACAVKTGKKPEYYTKIRKLPTMYVPRRPAWSSLLYLLPYFVRIMSARGVSRSTKVEQPNFKSLKMESVVSERSHSATKHYAGLHKLWDQRSGRAQVNALSLLCVTYISEVVIVQPPFINATYVSQRLTL
jgi:hypothetical protein